MLIIMLLLGVAGMGVPSAAGAIEDVWTIEVESANAGEPADFSFHTAPSEPELRVEFFGSRFVKVGSDIVFGTPGRIVLPMGVREVVLRAAKESANLRVRVSASRGDVENAGSATGPVVQIQWDDAGVFHSIWSGPPDALEQE